MRVLYCLNCTALLEAGQLRKGSTPPLQAVSLSIASSLGEHAALPHHATQGVSEEHKPLNQHFFFLLHHHHRILSPSPTSYPPPQRNAATNRIQQLGQESRSRPPWRRSHEVVLCSIHHVGNQKNDRISLQVRVRVRAKAACDVRRPSRLLLLVLRRWRRRLSLRVFPWEEDGAHQNDGEHLDVPEVVQRCEPSEALVDVSGGVRPRNVVQVEQGVDPVHLVRHGQVLLWQVLLLDPVNHAGAVDQDRGVEEEQDVPRRHAVPNPADDLRDEHRPEPPATHPLVDVGSEPLSGVAIPPGDHRGGAWVELNVRNGGVDGLGPRGGLPVLLVPIKAETWRQGEHARAQRERERERERELVRFLSFLSFLEDAGALPERM